jgi:hypothetical protein
MRVIDSASHRFTNAVHRRDPIVADRTASFFAAVPKAKSANAAVDACGIPDGFPGTGAITSVSSVNAERT